jgi:hypothetical protein
MKALVRGFYISGNIGRQLAQIKGLNNSDEVWSFPTFFLSMIDNPAPLLLYDEILVDKTVLPLTIEYLESHIHNDIDFINEYLNQFNKKEIVRRIDLLKHLFNTSLFSEIDLETILNDGDVEEIKANAKNIVSSKSRWFRNEVDELKLNYGPYYATPDPLSFEALNTELFWQVSKKLGQSERDITILDDCKRGNLYRNKIRSLIPKETIREFFDRLPVFIIGLPKITLRDIDSFMKFHEDESLNDLRQIVTRISREEDEDIRKQLVQSELYEANSQLRWLEANEPSKINLLGKVLGFAPAAALMIQPSIWVSALGFASSTFSLVSELSQLRKYWEYRQKSNWFINLKSFAEDQAGFYSPAPSVWSRLQ